MVPTAADARHSCLRPMCCLMSCLARCLACCLARRLACCLMLGASQAPSCELARQAHPNPNPNRDPISNPNPNPQPGAELLAQGRPAPLLHVLVNGSVQLQRLPMTTAKPADGTSAPPYACGEYLAGDVMGVRSVLGGWKSEPASAMARSQVVTLAIERAAASSVLPAEVVASLLGRPDQLVVATSSAPASAVRSDDSGSFEGSAAAVLRVETILARGTLGVVAAAVHTSTGARFAVKRINQSVITHEAIRRHLRAERAALCSVAHPCICRSVAPHARLPRMPRSTHHT